MERKFKIGDRVRTTCYAKDRERVATIVSFWRAEPTGPVYRFRFDDSPYIMAYHESLLELVEQGSHS